MPITRKRSRQFLYREARCARRQATGTTGSPATPTTPSSGCRRGTTTTSSTTDPQTEVSLIYYPHKGGLEDRVFRIKTERSSATRCPEPRTGHNISNVEVLEQDAEHLRGVRFNWITISFRYKMVDTYFGTSFYTLDTTGEKPLIKRKNVVLKNDYIHHVVDIYHI